MIWPPPDTSYPQAVWIAASRLDHKTYGLYVHGRTYAPHQLLIAQAFTQLVNGELLHPVTGDVVHNLAISGPPRHGKTTVVDEHGICRFLGHWPWKSVMFFTSSDNLAAAYDAAIAHTLAQNERHAAVFPQAEPDYKKGWSTERGRYLMLTPGKDPAFKAYGMGAEVLGIGADLIVMDDPIGERDEKSPASMADRKGFYDSTISNRANPGAFQVFIGHRWGPDDFLDHLVKNWGFAWLNLPALSEN